MEIIFTTYTFACILEEDSRDIQGTSFAISLLILCLLFAYSLPVLWLFFAYSLPK